MHRRKFLIAAATTAFGGWRCAAGAGPISQSAPAAPGQPAGDATLRMDYLRELAAAVIEASSVQPGQSVAGSPPNTTGATLIRPGGRNDYPACWVRDFAMSLDCGLIPAGQIHHHLRLFARAQNGPRERRLASGGVIPPFAIADHVNFNGAAVFYPGAYSAGEDQGGEPWGLLPPADDHYYFVHIAYSLYKATNDPAFLAERIEGWPLLDCLIRAFDAPDSDERTGAVTTTESRRAVGFGFFDSVYMTGAMLFPSLLRYQAALELTALCRAADKTSLTPRFKQIAARILAHLPALFASADRHEGWLKAATGVSGQPDVWGTLLALHLKVLPHELARRAQTTLAQAVQDGTIEYSGAVRHVPANRDAGPNTAWQRSLAAHNTYQNGAYWHTPTGWLVAALRLHHPPLAQAVLQRYLDHLRAGDFRQGANFGAPWECLGRRGAARQNPVYMTSVTLPLAALSIRGMPEL